MTDSLVRDATAADGLLSIEIDVFKALLASRHKASTRTAYERALIDFFLWLTSAQDDYLAIAPTKGHPVKAGLQSQLSDLCQQFLSLDRGAAVAHLARYQACQHERGISANLINLRLSAVKSLAAMGKTLGVTPWDLSDIKALAVVKYRDTRGVSLDVYRRILDVCDRTTAKGKRDYAILALLWCNGLRRAEVAGCNIRHFDASDGTLTILGKGQLQTERVDLDPFVVSALNEWLATRGHYQGSDPLFTGFRPGRHHQRLSGSGLYQLVVTLAQDAGLGKRFTPHKIRHSAITHYLRETGDVRGAQRLSRHRDLNTLIIYDDQAKELQKGASAVLAQGLAD